MEDIHGERQGMGLSGSRARGRQTCACWGAGGPRGLPPAAPTPTLGLLILGRGGVFSRTALPDPAAHMYSAPPRPCPWTLGAPL